MKKTDGETVRAHEAGVLQSQRPLAGLWRDKRVSCSSPLLSPQRCCGTPAGNADTLRGLW